MFLDEPTTGLDSFSAYSVINTLKYLTETDYSTDETTNTNEGIIVNPDDIELLPQKQCAQMAPKAVLCSIHQPTSDIFASFSHIILMCAGRCVYQGTTEQALIHFSRFLSGFCAAVQRTPTNLNGFIFDDNLV